MNCIKDGKFTGYSCFGCDIRADNCEIRYKLLFRPRWIPVSERLPEDIVNPITRDAYVYPVTVDLGKVTDIRYYSFCRGHWYNQGSRDVDSLVLAWLPFPEPYNPADITTDWKQHVTDRFSRVN